MALTDEQKSKLIMLEQLGTFKTLLNNVFYTKPVGGIPKADLVAAVQTSLDKADTALQSSDLETLNGKVAALEALISEDPEATTHAIDKFNEIVAFLAGITDTQTLDGIISGINNAIAAKYTKPNTGIPATDMAQAVQNSLGLADSAYQKPTNGIPKTDLASDVQTSLGKADTALQSSDIANKADKDTDAVAGNIAQFDANGNPVDSGHALSEYKTKQTAVSDPTSDGSGVAFIDSVSQDANGVITPHKKNVQNASASQAGIMSASHYSKLEAITYATDSDIQALFA